MTQKSRYASPLFLELLTDAEGFPLSNKFGNQLWRLADVFAYTSAKAEMHIVVPKGFVTDFASVPRVPFIYDSLGNIAHMPAVLHDYLYSTAKVSRKLADEVLLEAMEVSGISWVKRRLIYAGVRLGGGMFYGSSS